MSIKNWPGGRISSIPPTPSGPFENSSAPGVWTLDQAAYWKSQNLWPTAGNIESDPNFEYVTMLLHGDGTNGAQNNTFLDSSANNFTITRGGAATQGSFSPYGPNWSNYFDGDGDYLNFGTSSQLTLSGDFTVEGWVFVENTSAVFKRIFHNVATGDTPSGYFYVYTNGTDVRMYNVDVGVLPTVGTFTPSQWFHLAISRSSGTTRVFINGTQTYSYSGSTVFTNNGWIVGGGPTQEFHQGYISNHRVVVGSAVYTSNFTPSTTPLTAVANTRLLTCQSNRFIDNSTNNFIPSSFGNTSVQRFSPFVSATAYNPATIGGSGYFNGSSELLLPSNAALAPEAGNFCFDFWIYYTGIFSNSYIGAFVGDGSGGIFIGQLNTGLFGVRQRGLTDTLSVASPPTRQWVHIAVTRSGSDLRMFYNGIQQGSTVTDSTNYAAGPATVGSSDFSYFGYISNFRFVKGSAVYTSNFTPPTAPVTAITNTQLLTNFTNGAIVDNAMMNDLETVGDTQISTSVVLYGTGSIAFDGAGDSLRGLAASPNFQFSTGDFTVEMWVYTANISNFQALIDTRSGDTQSAWGLYLNDTGNPYWYDASGVQLSSVAVAANTWTHLAVSRSGSTLRIFLSGVQVFSGTNSNAQNPTGVFYVGRSVLNTFQYIGYIDELRITKGVARYTANFTPPPAAFPNF